MARTPIDKNKDKVPVGLPGDTIRLAPNGDYTHGHPGLPNRAVDSATGAAPKDDKAPKEGRR